MKIKFKAKAKDIDHAQDEKGWVYGGYNPAPDGEEYIVIPFEKRPDRVAQHIKVKQGTVCQHVFAQDKEGTDIYVGDILEDENVSRRYLIIAVPGGFGFNTFQDELKEPVFYNSLADMQNCGYITTCCKIIGNKQDNAELLER